MKTIILITLILTTNFLSSQIVRKTLDYTVNQCEVVRRIYDKSLTLETPMGDITLLLYSDSVSPTRQSLNLLICYPNTIKNKSVKLIVHYLDKSTEMIPDIPDVENCSVYYFLDRSTSIQYKKVKNLTFLGIDKFDLQDSNYFIDFINLLKNT